MLTKNLTPFAFAATSISMRPPTPSMSVVVRGTFAIADDGALTPVAPTEDPRPLSSQTFREDDDCLGGCVYPSDFADYKVRAEVILKGSCHAPNGRAVSECPVNVKVGSWSKSLRVLGRRVWGGAAPAPFVTMPLDWEHAYGGLRFPKNPSGAGFDSDEMPNVLHGKDVTRSRGDASLEPAGYGPINVRWPQRAQKLGQDYGETYRKKRAPHYAADMDPTYFLESSPDQWLDGYLRGDEPVVLQNLHPRVQMLATRLPGVVARAFYRDEGGAFREIDLSLDTLFIDADASRLELSWRGAVDVREEDLADVKTLLVASEALGGPKQPLQHYERIAAVYEADPIGLTKMPAPSGPVIAPGETPQVAPILEKRLGEAQPIEVAAMAPLLDKAITTAVEKDPAVKNAFEERSREMQPGSKDEEAPPPRVSKPGAHPYVGIRRRVRDTIERAAEARKQALEKGAKPDQLGQLMTVEELAEDPRWLKLDPSYTPPQPLSTDPPGPGANLVDRDLRGMNLAGADLRGANLEGAILLGTNLEGANLSGARLYGATLYKANLVGANLQKADLSRANVAFAIAKNAKLDEANVEQAFFEDADLTGASFGKAMGTYAIFTRAKLTGASFRGAQLPDAELDDAELAGAHFQGADLSRARLITSRCAKADFSGADLRKASFESCDLSDARLFDMRADGAVFASASAKRAIFAFAKMRSCFMDRLDASRADFHGADLRDSRLHRAILDGAKLTSSNLFGVDLWRARLEGAKLAKANLYSAKLTAAVLKDCDLSGANLKRSTLEGA